MKNIGKLVLGNLLVLTLFSGCKGEGFQIQSASGIQNESEIKAQDVSETQMPGAVQMSDNVGIHEKETLDEEEQEKQAVKAKVEKAIGESFDDDDWEYVDASECHVGSLDRGATGAFSVECYRDGEKMYVLYNPDSGMHQYINDVCYSTDGGATWGYKHLHGMEGGPMYFVNDTIIMKEGSLIDMGQVMYGSWTSEFSRLKVEEINKMIDLLGIGDSWGGISFCNQDAENNMITIHWFPGEDTKDYFYKITLNLDTMEKVSEDDPYGLEEIGEAYAKTGYIYADSAETYLDEIELNAKYLKLISLFGNTTWVEREIRYAINEIYARKGYDFTGTSYERYFAEKDWYHPIVGKQVTEEELNSYEKANIDLLVKIEKEVQAAMPDEA